MKPIIIFLISLLFFVCLIQLRFRYDTVPSVSFPFKNLFDDKGNKLNVILIAAPFREIKDEQLYEYYKDRGLSFCGISSYLDFPNPIVNPYEDRFHVARGHNYTEMVQGWLNCFRKPEYIEAISHLPNILLTEADLKDVKNFEVSSFKKEYDFLYCCLPDDDICSPGWQSYNRNWDLAKKCLEIMCSVFKLRGAMVGRQNCDFTEQCNGIVKVFPALSYDKFQEELKKSRVLFVPNVSDASPRVMTEAMCYNIPVLVNESILGGWHNVVPGITGEFFNDERDISFALKKILTTQYHPRKWYMGNRGKEISGKKLADFLVKTYPNINNKDMKYATITV